MDARSQLAARLRGRWVPGLLALAVLASLWGVVLHDGAGGVTREPLRVEPRAGRQTTDSGRDEPALLVDVSGAVRRPGVYELDEGARVLDAVHAAGGPAPGADLAAVNRAAEVVDGQQVLVPARIEAGAGNVSTGALSSASAPGGAGTTGRVVSLNGADVTGLDTLPGIGPVTAERIVADRTANGPFRTVEELDRVPGIGPGTVERLRGSVGP